MKEILLNGEPHAVAGASTISELVEELGLAAPTVLIEHNGLALHRSEWATSQITEADCIEILRVSAGG